MVAEQKEAMIPRIIRGILFMLETAYRHYCDGADHTLIA